MMKAWKMIFLENLQNNFLLIHPNSSNIMNLFPSFVATVIQVHKLTQIDPHIFSEIPQSRIEIEQNIFNAFFPFVFTKRDRDVEA